MPDLKTMIDREADKAQVSADALERTRAVVHRRHVRRRWAGAAVAVVAFVPAMAIVWVALSARTSTVLPIASSSTGSVRSSVTVPRCPADRSLVDMRSSEQGAATALVPDHPTVAAQCDYGPAGAGAPGPLMRSQDVGGKMAAAASILDGLAIDPNNGTGIFCPFDDGSEAILLIGYPDGGQVTIEIHLKGCQMVSNGWLTARTTPGSRSALEALLGVRFGPS
jgi:hypothetical protein